MEIGYLGLKEIKIQDLNKMSVDAIAKSIGLQTFDGLKDPKDFIKSFKLQAMCFKWSEAEQCQAIQLLLTDKAETLFEALTDDKKKVIAEIYSTLNTSCTTSSEVLLDRFFEKRPAKNELLSQYALGLEQAIKKALPGLKAPEREMLLRRQLGTYLPEHMRALISFNAHKSWEDVLTSIDKALPHTKAADGFSATASFMGEGGGISVKTEPIDIMATGVSNGFPGVCNYCREPGHKIADCDKAKASSKRKESESRYAANGAKTGSSRFDSSRQYSSNDSSYRSNKPRENSSRYNSQNSGGNNYGKRFSGSSRGVNKLDLELDDEDECYDDGEA